jgi:hypothetical protein
MMGLILAQAGGGLRNFDMSIGGILVAIVVIAAAIALVYVALRQFGISIPPWLIQVFWILVVAVVVIFAIKLVLSMW